MSSKAERTERNALLLRAAGYVPSIKAPGEIHFKKEGGNYVLLLDDEEAYWSLIYPRFWTIRDEAQRARAEVAAIAATEGLMVAKVHVTRDNADVSATVELFLPPQADPPLARAILALAVAVDQFKERVNA